MKTEKTYLPMSLMDLSHEIRTPLTGIAGMVEFLKQESLSQQQHNYVKDIQTACLRLQKLADFLSK